ncbi:MAG: hypothetical protein ABIQ12_05955 [Opitutaceae bacterium]
MPAQSLPTEALVLSRRSPTERFQNYTVFSAEHGLLTVMQRLARQATSSSLTLDLFDEVGLLLESSNQGRTWFVKEATLITRHLALGRSYETLRQASALGALIARNSVHEESRSAVAALLRHAFAAFATSARPDLVFFKSLYRFARDEGYPVKQDWFATLPASDREIVAGLLNRPLAEQAAEPAVVTRLQRRLEDYLRGHTDILLD